MKVLLSKEAKEKRYDYGLLMTNNNLFFAGNKTLFLLDDKLNEIKSKTLYYCSDISGIVNYDKKILVRKGYFYIFDLNLEIETIIYYCNNFSTINRFYINNYISITSFYNEFIFIDSKKYMVFECDIPYLYPPFNNKIIFGRLRNEKNNNKIFDFFYKDKKIYIVYSNNLLIYQSPN